jgi:glutaminyl-tRNA synthetase
VEKDETGEVVGLRCTYDPASRGGEAPDGRKVRGTVHWVSAAHAVTCEVRLYDHLFASADPDEGTGEGRDWLANLNPASLEVVQGAMAEPSLADAMPGERLQFERLGYFCRDAGEASDGDRPVFNRTVALKDSWAKIARKAKG